MVKSSRCGGTALRNLSGDKGTILVVDSEASIRRILQTRLEMMVHTDTRVVDVDISRLRTDEGKSGDIGSKRSAAQRSPSPPQSIFPLIAESPAICLLRDDKSLSSHRCILCCDRGFFCSYLSILFRLDK